MTKKRNRGNKMELIVATVNSIEISPYVSSASVAIALLNLWSVSDFSLEAIGD